MARKEHSAGVVVFRIDPQVPGDREFLLLDYGRYWDLPKGHVEAGETDLVAALRELGEETGIRDARIVEGFSHEIMYFFRSPRGAAVRKTVIFFLAQTTRKTVKISHEHVGYAFLPFDEALQRMSYDNSKAVLRAAEVFLRGRDDTIPA